MPLDNSDVERLKKIAKLADGTSFDGEKQKSIMVALNILRDKGGLSFLQIIEKVAVVGPSESSWSGSDSRYREDDQPRGSTYGSWNDFFRNEREQQANEERTRQNNERRRWEEQRDRQAQKTSKFYKHTGAELDWVMDHFFAVYTHERQRNNLNKVIITFIVQHSFDIMVTSTVREKNTLAPLRPTESSFIFDMSCKDGFELFLSEKQFQWLVEIYRKVRRHLIMIDAPIKGQFWKEYDVLYKTFLKHKVDYLYIP